jgi:hypothetical protein
MTDPRDAAIGEARELLTWAENWMPDEALDQGARFAMRGLRSALRALDAAPAPDLRDAIAAGGPVPLGRLARMITSIEADRDRLAADLARLRALVRHLELAHDCDECDAIRAALEGT